MDHTRGLGVVERLINVLQSSKNALDGFISLGLAAIARNSNNIRNKQEHYRVHSAVSIEGLSWARKIRNILTEVS